MITFMIILAVLAALGTLAFCFLIGLSDPSNTQASQDVMTNVFRVGMGITALFVLGAISGCYFN